MAAAPRDGQTKNGTKDHQKSRPTGTNGASITDKNGNGKQHHQQSTPVPGQEQFDKQLVQVNGEIESINEKLSAARAKISSATNKGPAAEKKNELRVQLDALRQKQAVNKQSKQKYQDQLKQINDSIQRKLGEFKTTRDKLPFKTIGEVDNKIVALEKAIESGSLKLIDEKRTLTEISALKKARKTLEGFQAIQTSIDADRKQYEELKKHLDDPEAKSLSNQYNEIKTQLDAIKQEADAHFHSRDKIFKERDELQKSLDEAWTRKKELLSEIKKHKDAHFSKIREERDKRNERFRQQRVEAEVEKVKNLIVKKREEASNPAFEQEMLICDNLIQYFDPSSTKADSNTAINPSSSTASTANIRQPDPMPAGSIVIKKVEEDYFVGGGGKKKKSGNKGGTSTPTKQGYNIPLSIMEDLMTLKLSVPLSQADVPTTIDSLKEKKVWFAENQEKQNQQNKERLDKEIKDMEARLEERKAAILAGEDRRDGNKGNRRNEEQKKEEVKAE